MQVEVICLFLKFVIFSIIYFSLTADFIRKHDFLKKDILEMMFCTLVFTIFTQVLIIKLKFGFDWHGYFPLFADSNISQTT